LLLNGISLAKVKVKVAKVVRIELIKKPLKFLNTSCITVVAVVTDNAFKIVGAIKILAAKSDSTGWRHVACFAHSLSFVVKAIIEKNAELSPLLTDARAIVTIFPSNHKATA
jgi:hypothetical protein